MAARKYVDDIINLNVGGKKYTLRRSDFLADPRSKLAEWFKPNTLRPIAMDKGGNYFLDRDPKTFRHIVSYLRLKREKFVPSLALPSKPDQLAKLVGECEALNLGELKELALEMLQKYQRTEEQHYVTSYVQVVLRDHESWQFEQEKPSLLPHSVARAKRKNNPGGGEEEGTRTKNEFDGPYDEWDTLAA